MSLEDTFPKDPFTPSLPYAASTHFPINLPWGGKVLRMGTPLTVGSGPQDTMFYEDRCAFSTESLKKIPLVFRTASRGMIAETSTHTAASSQEHTSFSLQAQIGGSVIGVSGRAKYEAHAAANRKARNESIRSEYQLGSIGFGSSPRLSPQALELLRSRPDPQAAFQAQFGDYYVGAYLLGGANAQLVSSNAVAGSFSKDLSGKGEAHFLVFSAEKEFEEHERGEASAAQMQLTAFDSLQAWEFQDPGSGDVALLERIAGENQGRCRTLADRVACTMEPFRLQDGTLVSWDKCEDICRAHLVVHVLLLPYTKLKEYASAVLSTS